MLDEDEVKGRDREINPLVPHIECLTKDLTYIFTNPKGLVFKIIRRYTG